MELVDIIRGRRSIRKYQARRVEKKKLDAVAEAGLYAPNPGGRQGSGIVMERPGMRELLDRWGLDPACLPIVFVCLGYIRGGYPPPKARLEGRYLYVPASGK